GNVTLSAVPGRNVRDAMYYVMTGETFDGRKAAAMGLVNEAVPKKRLRTRTRQLAKVLLGKNPTVLRTAKIAVRAVQGMAWELSDDYLMARVTRRAISIRSRAAPTASSSSSTRNPSSPALPRCVAGARGANSELGALAEKIEPVALLCSRRSDDSIHRNAL